MGFTRFWKRTDKEIDQDVVDMAKAIIDYAENNYHIKLAGWGGHGSPIITTDDIVFNGDATQGEGCDTFDLLFEFTGSGFCQTMGRPYDIVVNAMLKMLEMQGLVKDVNSDGEETQELLEKALEIKMSTDDSEDLL